MVEEHKAYVEVRNSVEGPLSKMARPSRRRTYGTVRHLRAHKRLAIANVGGRRRAAGRSAGQWRAERAADARTAVSSSNPPCPARASPAPPDSMAHPTATTTRSHALTTVLGFPDLSSPSCYGQSWQTITTHPFHTVVTCTWTLRCQPQMLSMPLDFKVTLTEH
ncbi:uncharacterized protein LOC134755211 [Cydia strobilella]|uniref:uncharacterized protein LOC134755211 n=1 Tax=Cydia strobilella TaxID=1100964 RepID=UPI00300597FF